MQNKSLDHLTLLPKMTSRSMWARFAIVSSLRAILVAVKPWHVNDPNRPEGVGVGAFNMVRRVAFEHTMGFEWFKMDVADDVALGITHEEFIRTLKCFTFYSSCRMVSSVEQVFLGLEKNAFSQVPQIFVRGCSLVV